MRYYINGNQVSSTQAWDKVNNAYLLSGGDPAEFDAVWEQRDHDINGEQSRELLNEWSGYVVEIFTDEEDEANDD